MSFFEKDSCEYLTFLNLSNNSIYWYDYSTSAFLAKHTLGDPSLKRYSAYAYSGDSLFLFESDHADIEIRDLTSGETVFQEHIPSQPYPYCLTLTPLATDKKDIFTFRLSDETAKKTDRYALSALDIESHESHQLVKFPEVYRDYTWGSNLTFQVAYFCIGEGGKIIASFPSSHDLVVFDPATQEESSFYAGSSSIDRIQPFAWKRGVPIPDSKEWRHFVKTPTYEGILYDKYRNVYYRFARLPWTDWESGMIGNKKPTIVIVLDHDFNHIGETALPQDATWWYPFNSFVTTAGINIQVIDNDDSHLAFRCLNINLD